MRWFKNSVYGGNIGYDKLSNEVSHVPPWSHGVTYLPHLTGVYSNMTDVSGTFLNMTLDS